MSSWGLTDNAAIKGTVTGYTTNVDIQGTTTEFLTNVRAGDYLTIAGQKYQINNVTSNTALTLTSALSSNIVANVAYVQTGPKAVGNVNTSFTGRAGRESNLLTIQNVYGVDAEEANVPENRARNLKTPGWVTYNTYTDALGQTRHKSEVLVALSKSFDSANISDYSDDAVVADYLLYFSSQPANASADTGNGTSFVSVAASSPTGATITYQWRENNTTHTYNLSDGGVYANTATNTLSITDVTGLDGYSYSVVISAAGTGADDNTSTEATLTETTP